MKYNVKVTKHFEKDAKPLFKKYSSLKKDLSKLISDLEENPESGIYLGNNLFKIRIAISSKGRGKSSGARVISMLLKKEETVYLVSIYDKAEYDTVNTENLLRILKEEGL
jgi:mRNA-degrading endonuclease RelE of RelBE toxin-antitoxin system